MLDLPMLAGRFFSMIHLREGCLRQLLLSRLRGVAVVSVWMLLAGPGGQVLSASPQTTSPRKLEFRGQILLPPQATASQRTISVTLLGVQVPYSGRTRADSKGKFRFQNLQPGTYSLSIFVPGAGEIIQTVEITPSFANSKGRVEKQFLFDRKSLEAQARTVPLELVSVRELSIPSKARGEYEKAQDRLRRNEVERAIQHLEKAIEIAPQFMEAWNNLGTIHFKRQDYAAAERYFRRALEQVPEAFEPLVNLGGVLLATRRYAEALEINRGAHETRPQDALANGQLGMNYFLLGDYDQALEYLQLTKELDPAHFTHPQISLAEIYLQRSEEQAALRELEDFLEQHPDSPKAGNVRAMIRKIQQSPGS